MTRRARVALAMHRRSLLHRYGTPTFVDARGVRWFYVADIAAARARVFATVRGFGLAEQPYDYSVSPPSATSRPAR